MNFSLFIANRFVSSRATSFTRTIINIAVFAVALSMVVMVVATSLISGFQQEINKKIFGFWGHIQITDVNVNRNFESIPVDLFQPFYPSLDTVRRVQFYYSNLPNASLQSTKGGVKHIQAFAIKPGIIKTKNVIEGIVLKGVGQDYDWSFMQSYLQEGRILAKNDTNKVREILISQQTANRLNVTLNEKFIIFFVNKGAQSKRVFQICGIYKTGLEEYDRKIALANIEDTQELLGWDRTQVSGFEVFLDDIADLQPISEYIYAEKLPEKLYATTIREKFSGIFEWLDLQNINERVILGLMVFVAIINMMTALLILILERTNMIGILKCLGTSDWVIRKIFIYHAAYILLVGLFWGNLIGLSLCWLQKTFRWIKLTEADYYLSYAPVEISFNTVLMLNGLTLFVTLLFLLIPSWLVTKVTPIKAIQFK